MMMNIDKNNMTSTSYYSAEQMQYLVLKPILSRRSASSNINTS